MAKASKAGRPILACEITGVHAFVARAADSGPGIEVLQTRTFPEGLTPNLINPNIPDREAVKIVLADAFLHVGSHSKEITLVVPDAAVRVVLLDFDTLPDRKAEADAVVRFRLKKALPFDVDRAAISYHAQPNGTTVKVIVAVMMNSVLAEYESVIHDAGYMPGVVMPSTLAALGNVEGNVPSMVVKIVEGSTTIAILNQGRLLFYRTLDHGSTLVIADRLAEDIYPSLIFFQDMYGVPIERVYISGVDLRQPMVDRLSQETSAIVEELVNPQFAGLNPGNMPKSLLAGVLGALT